MKDPKFRIGIEMDLVSYNRFIAMHNVLGYDSYSETIHYLLEHVNLPDSKTDMFKHEYKRLRTKNGGVIDDG